MTTEENFWDDLYGEHGQRWSGRPNVVLERELTGAAPGTALDLGCGEGGDAVWLAAQGWVVVATDISGVALERAAGHARDQGVAERIDFQHRNLLESFPPGTYDLVSVQFLPREKVLRQAAAAVAPGGLLLIEGHLGTAGHDASHGHHDEQFPSHDEVVKLLGLDGPEWELLLSEGHDRHWTNPEGEAAVRQDSTVKARRSTTTGNR